MRAFNTIASNSNVYHRPPDNAFTTTPIENYSFIGTGSRNALCLTEEPVFDTAHVYSDVRFTPEGSIESFDANDHSSFYNCKGDDAKYLFYEKYYETEPQAGHANGPGKTKSLVVSDSYGAAIFRFIAEQSSELELSNDLHSSSSQRTMEEHLKNSVYNSVVFIAGPIDYALLLDKFPSYFSLD